MIGNGGAACAGTALASCCRDGSHARERTEEEALARKAGSEQQRCEYEVVRERKAAERQAELERQQKECEAEVKRREKRYKARLTTLKRIVAQAPALLNAAQLRFMLEL